MSPIAHGDRELERGEHVYSIHLWQDDRHEQYCGCCHVACPESDPARPRLEAAGVGLFRNDDGTTGRAFFFADELGEQLLAATRETECFAEASHFEPRMLADRRSR